MRKNIFQNTQLLRNSADNFYEGQNFYYLVLQGENGVFLIAVRHRLIVWWFCLLASAPAAAGVFESLHPVTAKPVRWLNPQEIPYNVDGGGLGQLNNDQAKELLQAMMAIWENESGGMFHFVDKGPIGVDVTTDTMKDYVDTSVCADNVPPRIASMIQGQSPIIFDTDGSIIDALSGPESSRRVVGKTAFRCFKGTLADPQGVTQAFLIMNGRFMDGLPDPIDLPLNVYAGVILHELGHYLGLHHSMVNEGAYEGVLNGSRPLDDSKYVPVMYPLILTNSIASTVLKPDDIAVLRSLYPQTGDAFGSISGDIQSSSDANVMGANIVARRMDDPLCQAVSAVSGRECVPLTSSASGEPSVLSEMCNNPQLAGSYKIRGLTPGPYRVEVSEIVDQGGARQNMFPKGLGRSLPGEPMVLPQPLTVGSSEVSGLNFKLSAIAGTHQTSIDEDVFLKNSNTSCKTDPVNYKDLVSGSGAVPADSSPSLSSPSAAASPGGCSLIR